MHLAYPERVNVNLQNGRRMFPEFAHIFETETIIGREMNRARDTIFGIHLPFAKRLSIDPFFFYFSFFCLFVYLLLYHYLFF